LQAANLVLTLHPPPFLGQGHAAEAREEEEEDNWTEEEEEEEEESGARNALAALRAVHASKQPRPRHKAPVNSRKSLMAKIKQLKAKSKGGRGRRW